MSRGRPQEAHHSLLLLMNLSPQLACLSVSLHPIHESPQSAGWQRGMELKTASLESDNIDSNGGATVEKTESNEKVFSEVAN